MLKHIPLPFFSFPYNVGMDYRIRPSTLADLPQIEAIYASARAFMRLSGNPNQWKDDRPLTEEVIRDIESGHHFLILVGDEAVAAFSALPSPDPTYSSIEGEWLNDNPYYVIHKIAKGRNVPGILETAVAFCLEKTKDVRIDTHHENRPMQKALSALGFAYCGVIHLTNGEPRNAYHLSV